MKNPLLQVQRDAAQAIRAFDLTPSARASVKAHAGHSDTKNPFAPGLRVSRVRVP